MACCTKEQSMNNNLHDGSMPNAEGWGLQQTHPKWGGHQLKVKDRLNLS